MCEKCKELYSLPTLEETTAERFWWEFNAWLVRLLITLLLLSAIFGAMLLVRACLGSIFGA